MRLVASPIAKPIVNGFKISVAVVIFEVFIFKILFFSYYFLFDDSKVGTH
ncbi:hypothetical protein [Flavobacterium pectinovorum]|nr:hypothetical protein [Flavobacterium pectinovorum]MCI9846573.1 hypothetical protein [Flavobacterium pectinovorum]